MTANELADWIDEVNIAAVGSKTMTKASNMLRQFDLAESIIKQQKLEINALHNLVKEQDKKIIDLTFSKVYAERIKELAKSIEIDDALNIADHLSRGQYDWCPEAEWVLKEQHDKIRFQQTEIDTYKLQIKSQVDTYRYITNLLQRCLPIAYCMNGVGEKSPMYNTDPTLEEEIRAMLRKAQEK
jgi:hypothetical protein